MGAHYLNLLCDPETPEALELQADGLVNVRSGGRCALRDGIPDFLGTISGQNKKYQQFYDRIARFYDWRTSCTDGWRARGISEESSSWRATMISGMIGTATGEPPQAGTVGSTTEVSLAKCTQKCQRNAPAASIYLFLHLDIAAFALLTPPREEALSHDT